MSTSKLVRRIDFFELAVTVAKTPSTTTSDVLGGPDLLASATLHVALNFASNLPMAVVSDTNNKVYSTKKRPKHIHIFSISYLPHL